MAKPQLRTRVYVGGPISKGDTIAHVRKAIDEARVLRAAGYAPVIPHLSVLDHLVYVRDYLDWLDEDFTHLMSCQLMVAIPGESSGTDKEKGWASDAGIPAYGSARRLIQVQEGIGPERHLRHVFDRVSSEHGRA